MKAVQKTKDWVTGLKKVFNELEDVEDGDKNSRGPL